MPKAWHHCLIFRNRHGYLPPICVDIILGYRIIDVNKEFIDAQNIKKAMSFGNPVNGEKSIGAAPRIVVIVVDNMLLILSFRILLV